MTISNLEDWTALNTIDWNTNRLDWERSEDGENWDRLTGIEVEFAVAGSFKKTGPIMDEMINSPGRVVRASFAYYRYQPI